MKAVQFGAGNIGRGFTGQLFSESGYEVVFVDVIEDVVREINARHWYPIRIACDTPYIVKVENASAVNGNDKESVAKQILEADLLCTAVGVNVLKFVAPAIARGIQRRKDAGVMRPLNIIICENMQRASVYLKEEVNESLPQDYWQYVDQYIGFVESVVGRMVPVMTEEQKREDPLLVVVEPYKHLPIDKTAIKGEWREIVGVEPAGKFQSYVDRKLYTHNAGHATAAYLGYLRGYEYLYEAMADELVLNATRAALAETGRALIAKHDLVPEDHQAHIEDLLCRFANKALGDQVARVGRDPVRKLGPEDRLVGGAKLAEEHGVFPQYLCKAIAAALHFNPEEDPTSPQVQKLISESGVEGALESISKLPKDSSITQEAKKQYPIVEAEFPRVA